MFPFTHSYILKRMYELVGKTQEEIPLEVILGNAMPDFIINFDLRHNGEKRDHHIEVHDAVPSEEVCYYDLDLDLERGFAVHVMADNFSRVGSFWRSNGKGEGFAKSLEKEVDMCDLEINEKTSTLARRIVQTIIDFAVLEENYDDMIKMVRAGIYYLSDEKESICSSVSEFTGLSLDHIHKRVDYMIERYGKEIHIHALKPIRAYSAIRVIDNHGQSQLTTDFVDMIEAHPIYPVVLANKGLANNWKEQLDNTAKAILSSPIGKYVK